MNKKAGVFVALLLIAAGFLATQAPKWFKPPPPLLIGVQLAPFKEIIKLRAHIEPQRFVDVQAPASSCERQLIQVAPEGSFVRTGEVVAEFDPGPLLLYIESIKENLRDLDMSKEELGVLMDSRIFEEQAGVRSSKENLLLTEIKKQTMAYEAGLKLAGSSVELNLAKQKVKTAIGRVGQVERQKEHRLADRVESARRLLDRLADVEAQLDQFTVTATGDSIVIHPPIPIAGELRKVETGDYLSRGQPFLRLPDLSSLVVRGFLEEAEVQRVMPGQKAKIHPIAYPSLVMDGEVQSVSRVATLLPGRGNRQFFEMSLRFDPADHADLIKVGMVVEVSIMIKDHGPVFAIPRDLAVAKGDSWQVKQMGAVPETVTLDHVIPCGDYLLLPEWPGGSAANHVTLVYEFKKPS